ncbi:hypothetical protein D3C81_1812900 [compost metagenome]
MPLRMLSGSISLSLNWSIIPWARMVNSGICALSSVSWFINMGMPFMRITVREPRKVTYIKSTATVRGTLLRFSSTTTGFSTYEMIIAIIKGASTALAKLKIPPRIGRTSHSMYTIRSPSRA